MLLDIATAYNKFQFLGYEFLLWLWYASEKEPDVIDYVASVDQSVEVTVGNSMTIEIQGTGYPERVTIKGKDAGFEEAFLAINKGGSIIQANLILKVDDQEFSFDLKGDDFSVRNLKYPPSDITPTNEDEKAGAILEKWFLSGEVFNCLDSLYDRFIEIRLNDELRKDLVSRIGQWVSESIKKEKEAN